MAKDVGSLVSADEVVGIETTEKGASRNEEKSYVNGGIVVCALTGCEEGVAYVNSGVSAEGVIELEDWPLIEAILALLKLSPRDV